MTHPMRQRSLMGKVPTDNTKNGETLLSNTNLMADSE